MATYIVLGHYTDKGILNVEETAKRADAAKEVARQLGAEIKALFWTIGRYDVALIIEAPDDETIATYVLSTGHLDNVRTETMRAFTPEEIAPILQRVV